jgi:hypothetical protein
LLGRMVDGHEGQSAGRVVGMHDVGVFSFGFC